MRMVPTGQRGESREQHFLNDVSVDVKADGIHVYVAFKIEEALPCTAFDTDTILGYSVRDRVQTQVMRTMGRYHFGSADITLDEASLGNPGLNDGYWITGFAKKLEDLKKLYRLIRAGEIQPYKSYERAQVVPVTTHLQRFKEQLERLRNRIRYGLYHSNI